MKSLEFDDMAFAGGEIITFIKKTFDESRVIITTSLSERDLFESDVTIKGLQTRLIELLEKFDKISGEMIVTENEGEVWFDFTPDDKCRKFIGHKISIEPEKDHRIEDFEEGGGARELYIKNKSDYIKKNSPVEGHENIEDKRKCLHCESVFQIKDYKVVAGPEIDYISCPYYPVCDGDILDWAPTDEPVHEGDLVYLYKTDRESYEERIKAQDQYLERYYGYREIETYRIKSNEGITVFFAPRSKRLLQLVIVKASLARKYGHILERRIKEEQKFNMLPDDGFTPAIMFLKADNLKYIGEI